MRLERLRIGTLTLASLAACAAAAAAALAHVAIDVVGDYALPHDTYDYVSHSSRPLVTGVALLVASVLAARGLRICCELGAVYRVCIRETASSLSERIAFVLGTVAASAVLVPAMEWLDGRLDRVPVKELDDAFGGSILLGLGTTVVCAAIVASIVYAFARWLVSHRDAIVAIIQTLRGRLDGFVRPSALDLSRYRLTPRRRRAPHALRLCKRGPPPVAIPATSH
ncbi:MAG: hypothetical protein WA814_04460 [Candidatus Baltobacteraceae bacterium]